MPPPLPPHSWAMAPPYHYHGTQQQQQPAAGDEIGAGSGGYEAEPRSLSICGLLHWMDEDYLRSCFTGSTELMSVVIKRDKKDRQSEGFGILSFADHASADQILQSYNGQKMPNADSEFKLHWFGNAAPQKRTDDDHTIYVGDLSLDVTDFMLHHVFKSRYPSVKSARVAWDSFAGCSKGYGFVAFGDVSESRQAMTEMNGAYCSARPMLTGPATNKKSFHALGTDTDVNQNNKRLFVGCLDLSVTDEDLKKAFSPCGEVTDVKVIVGKKYGFVTYSSRVSAENAMRTLNGSQLGDSTIRVNWGRPLSNKQYEQDRCNGECHVQPQGSDYGYCTEDPNMHGYTSGSGPGYAYYQQQQPQQTLVQ